MPMPMRSVAAAPAATAAKQILQEAAAAFRRARGIGVLLAAIVLRQRNQHRAALLIATGIAATATTAQPVEIDGDLIQIAAHALNLCIDRAALRRLAAEQREEARTLAAHPARLLGNALEFILLAAGRILVAAKLIVAGRVAAAAINYRQLALKPLTDRIARRTLRWVARWRIALCAGGRSHGQQTKSGGETENGEAGELCGGETRHDRA